MIWEQFPDIHLNRLRSNALSKIDQIRELHSPDKHGACLGCSWESYVPWPCETRDLCDEGTEFEETRHTITFQYFDWKINHPKSCENCTQSYPPDGRYTLGKFYCTVDSDGDFVLQEHYPSEGLVR